MGIRFFIAKALLLIETLQNLKKKNMPKSSSYNQISIEGFLSIVSSKAVLQI